MKKTIFLLPVLLAALTACTDDDSSYATGDNYIKIGTLEKSYSAVSYSGERLKISPQVTSSFSDDDLQYVWTCFNNAEDNTQHIDQNGNYYYIPADTIGTEKDLDYPVALTDGVYTLILTVTSKSTGYSQQVTTTLNAASALSLGFYILKENTEGNTDMDLYNTTSKTLIADVIADNQGSAIPGKPRWMDVDHQMAYINESGERSGANLLCITTENNEVRWIRALDCTTVMDASNCHYEEVEGEIPYRTVRGYWTEYYLTNNGVYSCYSSSQGGSGIFGAVVGDPASTHVTGGANSNYYGIIYFSDATGNFVDVNFNGEGSYAMSNLDDYSTTGLNCTCLSCGLSSAAGEMFYFILQDKADNSKKYLYALEPSFSGSTLTSVRTIDPTSHYAKASLRAINGQQATIAYAVDGNKVYSYNLANEAAEKELSFTGLPASETITFISNRYFNGTEVYFDYLIVGTQTGNTYKLYFYNMVGGEPDGEPEFVVTGNGIFKTLGYINPTVQDMMPEACVPILDE
jgi:hypothetical protein